MKQTKYLSYVQKLTWERPHLFVRVHYSDLQAYCIFSFEVFSDEWSYDLNFCALSTLYPIHFTFQYKNHHEFRILISTLV